MEANAMRRKIDWTDEQIEFLKEYWGSMSALELSKLLGRSRSAIIGKANRLGLPYKGYDPKKKKYGSGSKGPASRFGPRPKSPPALKLPVPKPPAPRPPRVYYDPDNKGIPLLDTSYGQCKAIIGSTDDGRNLAVVCGKQVEEGSHFEFCPGHKDVFIVIPRPR